MKTAHSPEELCPVLKSSTSVGKGRGWKKEGLDCDEDSLDGATALA
jgi:hypothetical protein